MNELVTTITQNKINNNFVPEKMAHVYYVIK